jgi:hypothetical protein
MSKLIKILSGKLPLFVSDELIHYSTILFEMFHSKSIVQPTHKRGRPRKSISKVDPELKYATVKKTRVKGRIVNVKKTIVYGSKEYIDLSLSKSNSNTIILPILKEQILIGAIGTHIQLEKH